MLTRMVLRIIERKSMGKQTRYFIKVLSTIRIDVYRSAKDKDLCDINLSRPD